MTLDAQTTTAGFESPVFDDRIDLDACVRACPASATARGTFFQFVADAVSKAQGSAPQKLYEGVEGRRWISWNSYPLTDFMRLAVNASRLLYPKEPLGQGLRRMGWLAFPSFTATMAGRVVAYAFGDDVDAVLQAIPKAYPVSLSHASAKARRLGNRHWEVGLRDVYNFADTYQLGVIEGVLRAREFTPEVRIRRHLRRCDVDLEVRW